MTITARELAARLVAQFDKGSTTKLDRALINILRAEGLGKFRSEEIAFQMEDAVLRYLEKYPPQEVPFLLKNNGKRLVGKSRSGERDSPEMVAARRAYAISGDFVKAGRKVHQWPQRKYISLRSGGNGGLASGRGSARGISPSLVHAVSSSRAAIRESQSYPGSVGG